MQPLPATSLQEEYPQLQGLNPLAHSIIDKTVDNLTRKFIGGYRNKKNSQVGAKDPSVSIEIEDTLKATSARSVLEVANRGVHWKELVCKSFSHGVASVSTMKFDGEFTVKNGVAEKLSEAPIKAGVYVVFDTNGEVKYIGSAQNIQKRWIAGHLNENKQCQRKSQIYKLANEFTEGCTVKFIAMDSIETALAVEANILATERPPINLKEELKNEQGTRPKIEAKKMKESMKSAAHLALGASKEAALNISWDIFEQLTAALIKALKDEVVDVFITTKAQLKTRLKRIIDKVWQVIANVINAPLSILKGMFEFILNALMQTIGKIYQLAKNIYDLGMASVAVLQGVKTLTREELITKISEVIITSGALIFWDALDPLIETGLTALFPPLAPFSPYISSTLSAVGFGITSYYLSKLIPKAVTLIIDTEPQFIKEGRATYQQILKTFENNEELMLELTLYAQTSSELISELDDHVQRLDKRGGKLTRFSLAGELEKLNGR